MLRLKKGNGTLQERKFTTEFKFILDDTARNQKGLLSNGIKAQIPDPDSTIHVQRVAGKPDYHMSKSIATLLLLSS